MISPCMRCERVKDPRECTDKDCVQWRRYFLQSWEGMRREVREQARALPTAPEGVNIGGTHYAPPHRVKGYLQTDPCKGCVCPQGLCLLPCARKRRWQNARAEVYGV